MAFHLSPMINLFYMAFLNAVSDSASLVFPPNLFQGSTTLVLKDFCLISRRDSGALRCHGSADARVV